MGGIFNFQVEDVIKKIGDEDLLDNFVGVFPSNYMRKFVNHSAMIDEKKENTLLLLQTQMQVIKMALIGGAY